MADNGVLLYRHIRKEKSSENDNHSTDIANDVKDLISECGVGQAT
jgi:hypothetical protein